MKNRLLSLCLISLGLLTSSLALAVDFTGSYWRLNDEKLKETVEIKQNGNKTLEVKFFEAGRFQSKSTFIHAELSKINEWTAKNVKTQLFAGTNINSDSVSIKYLEKHFDVNGTFIEGRAVDKVMTLTQRKAGETIFLHELIENRSGAVLSKKEYEKSK